jgi:hypothetical protein
MLRHGRAYHPVIVEGVDKEDREAIADEVSSWLDGFYGSLEAIDIPEQYWDQIHALCVDHAIKLIQLKMKRRFQIIFEQPTEAARVCPSPDPDVPGDPNDPDAPVTPTTPTTPAPAHPDDPNAA